MKFILTFLVITMAMITSCNKVDVLPNYKNGVAPNLSASVTTVAPTASDSLKTVLSLSWTLPEYATDTTNIKYVVEIDSSGSNFATEFTRIIISKLNTTFTAKELNNMLLAYGFAFNTAHDMDVRVTSSYLNNNERLKSNTLKIKMTPYKIPPKVALPSSGHLFLVGDASQGGWSNPVPVPSQEFSRLDETTFGGVFKLNAGKEYLILPMNGDWSHKFSVPDKSLAGLNSGGDFKFDANDNFPGPTAAGTYVIILDFQSGKFTAKPYIGQLPDNLFMVGDATPGGWSNPVPVPTQQFTRLNSSEFQLILPLKGSKNYLFLPVNGDWGHKYAVADNSIPGLANGGSFGYDLNGNFPGPTADGTYKINVQFVNNSFTVIKQ